jgi:acetyltransferase-like isoleucine patch superfamily enzyme
LSSAARRFARSVTQAMLGLAARLHAAAAFVAGGMDGVNRVLRQTTKPGIIPVLRMFGAQIGEACDLEAPLVLHNAHRGYRHLIVGSHCHLGKDVFLDLAERIIIGDRVTVSMRAIILTHVDAGQSPLADAGLPARRAAVTLGDGCYIGAAAIVLPGLEVGTRAVVGAGAVVTRPVPPDTVVVGSPARAVRRIPPAHS